jgi:hypothetical protein
MNRNLKSKRLSMQAMEAIAKPATKATLEGLYLSSDDCNRLVLGYTEDGDFGVFELYVPGERPQDARVIARARVNAYSGDVEVERLPSD